MANTELKALIRIGGDGTGAQQVMRGVAASAKSLGANVIKVQEQVNTALERRVQFTERRIAEASERLKAIDREQRLLDRRTSTARSEKGAIDPKIAGSVQAIVRANTALIRSEADLSKAMHDRQKLMIDGTRAEWNAQAATKEFSDAKANLKNVLFNAKATMEDLVHAENRLEAAEKADILAQAKLTDAHMKYRDAQTKVSLLEQQRAQRLHELNTAEAQAGEQTKRLAAAQLKLQEATNAQLKAEDRLLKAEAAVAYKPIKKNTQELEVARRSLAQATQATSIANTEYQKELSVMNSLEKTSLELETTIQNNEKKSTALDREKTQQKRLLSIAQEKLLALQERILNVTYRHSQANAQANTQWGKTITLVRGAGASYAMAGRNMFTAAQQTVQAFRNQWQQIRSGVAAIRQHALAARQLGFVWRPVLSNFRLGVPAIMGLGRALISTAKAMVNITVGTGKLVWALGRLGRAAVSAIGAMSRMRGIARGLGVAFATTGAHVGGIAVRLNAMQMGLYVAGGALTAFGSKGREVFGDLLKVAGEFQQELVTIAATLGSRGTSWTKDIREEAIRLGEKTMYDPNDAAKVMTDLIRGGATADAVVNGMAAAVLNLAQATGEDLNVATKAVITSTTQWASQALTAKDAVDQLTRAANASAATVEQLAGGLKNLGGIPAALGVSHEDTLALLGSLSEAGLRGPEGGTALRYFFLNLIPGTQKSIELMKQLDLMTLRVDKDQQYLGKSANAQAMNQEELVQAIWEKWSGTKRLFQEAIDQEDPAVARFQQFMARNQLITSKFVDEKTGELKDAASLMQVLWDKFGKMDPAQRAKQASAIFGERGGSKGAINLLNAYETNLRRYESGATDSKGNKLSSSANIIENLRNEMRLLGDAESIAYQRTQTFPGAVERLGSTFQSLKISIGEPLLRPLAALLNKFSDFISKIRIFLEENPKLLETVGRVGMIATGLLSVLGPLTLFSAAFPYLIAGIRGLLIAASPMAIMFGVLTGLVTGIVMAIMDPNLGVLPVLKNLQGAFMIFGTMVQQSLGRVFNEVIMPLGVTFALLFRDVIGPALFDFMFTISNALPGAVSGFASFVQTVVIPSFVNLVMWVGTWLPGAIQLLSTVWTNLLWPLFQGVGQMLATHALPILGALADMFSHFLPAAIGVLMGIWNNVLAPAISFLGVMFEQYVLPLLGQIFTWLGTNLPPVIEFLGYLLGTYIIPIIGKVVQALSLIIPPILQVAGVIIGWLIPVFKFAFDTIGPVVLKILDVVIWVFGAISFTVNWFITHWNDVMSHMPDALKMVFPFLQDAANFVSGIFAWIMQALNWLAGEWGKGFFGMRQPLEAFWGFVQELWNKIVGVFAWIGEKVVGFLDFLGVKIGEGAKAAGKNFGDGLNGELHDSRPVTQEEVKQVGLTFAGLAGPAGLSGYNTGFSFMSGLLDSLNTNIPALQATIDSINAALNATLDTFEAVKNTANGGVINDLDRKTLNLARRLAEANKKIGAAKKAQYAPGQYGSGEQSDDSGGGGGIPYDKQTDNRAGAGGGGGGGSTRTAAEAAADEAKKVFDAIKGGMEAFRQLARMQIPSNVEAKAREFAAAVAGIVKAVADVARGYLGKDGKTPLLDVAGAFGEAANKSMDMITKGVEAFAKLKDFEAPARDALDSFLATVKYVQDQVAEIVTKNYSAEQLVQSQQFAETATKSMEMLDKGLDAFGKVGKFVKPAQERLHDLVETIKVAVQEVAQIADSIGPEAEAAAAEYSGYASTIVDSIGKVADLVQKLNDPKLDLTPVTDKVQSLANEMLAMMNYMGDLWTKNPGWTPENAEKVAALGDSASKVAGGLAGVMDMLTDLSKDKGKTDFAGLADRVRSLSNAMLAMMNYLGPLAAPWDGFSELPARFAEDAGKVAAGLGSMIDLFKSLSDRGVQKIGFSSLADRVQELANSLSQMVYAVRTAVGETPDISGLADYSDTAGKIIGSLDNTLELLDKASNFKAGRTDPKAVVQRLVGFMVDLVKQFAGAREEFEQSVSAETAQLADDTGKIVSSLGGALDTFDKLSTFRGVAQSRIAAFISALRQTVTAFKPLVDEIAPDMLDMAKEWGEKLGPAFELLGKALDLFKAITGEVDEEGKVKNQFKPVDPDAIGEFTGKLLLLINRMKEDLLTKVAPEMLDLAEEFANKFGPAMDVLAKSLDFFLKIQGTDENDKLKPIDPDAIGAVVGSIYVMLKHWKNLIQGGEFQDSDFAQRTADFGGLVGGVLDTLNSILDLANRIIETNKDGGIDKLPAQIEQLVNAMKVAAALTAPQVDTEWGGMFADLTQTLKDQGNDQLDGTIGFLWWGKGTGILWRMWQAVEGKNSLRPILRLAFEGLFNDISTALEAWSSAIKPVWSQAMQELANTAVQAMNQIRATLGSLASSGIHIDYTVSWSGPKLAAGGVVTRPTMALIGEGHEPEAVIPLSKLGTLVNTQNQSRTVVNNWNIRQVAVKKTTDLQQESARLRRQSTDNT